MTQLTSTMQDSALTITAMLRHGQRVYATSVVQTVEGDTVRSATYAQVGERATRLAGALAGLGVRAGDRVGTLMWNTQEHLEAYLAVPSMGAVLHTLNLRLFPEQLAYVINHGQDKVVIVDASVLPVLARVAAELTTVQTFVVVGDGDTSVLGDVPVHSYDELLAAAAPTYDWPELDEREPAGMCYTSGTTGHPKGVVYSHRSTVLHSMASAGGQHVRVVGARPDPAGRADVPRQRLGAALRRLAGGRRLRASRPLPTGRAVGSDDHRAPADRCRRRPDDLE